MNKHYHLIGIGGIGMSGIAALLLKRGNRVSGSDLKTNMIIRGLEEMGARVFIGHNAVNIAGADCVIYSSAIKADNPEMAAAKEKGVTLIKRAQALAELMENKSVITVAGSHGKTTTTSLVSCLLLEAGFAPALAIGGILKNIGANACQGDGKYFVAEADESDGSFLYYRPRYSIITNIDREHLDYYRDFQHELDTFAEFMERTEEDGCLFCCSDDQHLLGLLKNYKKRYALFGMTDQAGVYPKEIVMDGLHSRFDCFRGRDFIGRFDLALGGMHNISNALSVISLGLELGIDLKVIQGALAGYKGAGRRQEIKYDRKDCLVIDDYAHHPTEIMATLAAVKNLKSKRVIAVFQPHRYTRTRLLLEEFSRSFDAADDLIITDIYPASEPPIPGVNGAALAEKVKARNPRKEVRFLPKDQIVARLLEEIRSGDLVITLGAGDIIKICEELVVKLNAR